MWEDRARREGDHRADSPQADKRYRQFDHMPEVREQWLRDYLENLEGSKGSETIHKVGPA